MSEPCYGDIYMVNFDPSIGHEYQKIRPAVIIEADCQLKKSNLITVMPLTSQVIKKRADDILVHKNQTNRLYADSLIKVHTIASFDRQRFGKKVGTVDNTTVNQIKRYLRIHFDLS